MKRGCRRRGLRVPAAPPTGFLYRESHDLTETEKERDWRAFNDAKYLESPARDRLAERKKLPLFITMADALTQAIQDALAVYHQPPAGDGRQRYFSLLVEGIGHLQRGFSWDVAAAEYNSYIQ